MLFSSTDLRAGFINTTPGTSPEPSRTELLMAARQENIVKHIRAADHVVAPDVQTDESCPG